MHFPFIFAFYVAESANCKLTMKVNTFFSVFFLRRIKAFFKEEGGGDWQGLKVTGQCHSKIKFLCRVSASASEQDFFVI